MTLFNNAHNAPPLSPFTQGLTAGGTVCTSDFQGPYHILYRGFCFPVIGEEEEEMEYVLDCWANLLERTRPLLDPLVPRSLD